MNARTVRIQKEARQLVLPWFAVMGTGLLPLIFPNSRRAVDINLLSFFFGLPLLATLSLGNEFHDRTLSLWLTQPASRLKLWGEKMSVMTAAVLSAGLVSGTIMLFFSLPRFGLTYNKAAAVAYVLVTVASATYWTLSTRSTLGGCILIGCIFGAFYTFLEEVPHLPVGVARTEDAAVQGAATLAISMFAACFCCLMLWLGVRKLAAFQVTGGTSGEDLLLSGPSVMPESFAVWFRARPSGPYLNLIRKELRLLRPLWVMESLTLAYAGCLAMFRLLPVPPVAIPVTVAQWALLGPTIMSVVGMGGLAGILSVGEERRSGTHDWHMALPVSSSHVWVTKLMIALLSGLACSVLLPVLILMAAGAFYGSPFLYVHLGILQEDLILFPILTFACFWCACAADGSVRAAVWAVPVIGAIPVASYCGIWLGRGLAQTTGTLKDFLVASFHRSPSVLASATEFARTHTIWLFVPALLFGVIQSCRLFQTQPQANARWLVQCLVPGAAITILWSFSAYAGLISSRWEPLSETRLALNKLRLGGASGTLTGVEVADGSALSETTQRWLAGSTVTIVPDQSHPPGYLATIHLASGIECRLLVTQYGGAAESCGR